MNFSDLGLSPEVLRAVEEAGYSQPTPIQEKAIPVVLTGRDVMGCAQTGTGKTASFALPMLDILASGRARARMPRALILEPTRELAAQVAEAFAEYGKYRDLQLALLIGGVSMDEQSKQLERGADILIATPGRLLDHVDRGQVMLHGTKMLVIDETDRMLDMGFIPDVQRIVKQLPPLRQTLFFSATLSPEIRALGAEFVHNPKEITVAPPSTTASAVRAAVLLVREEDKRDALRRIIAQENVEQAIIFLNRKRDVDILLKSMRKHGFAASAIHGDLAQSVRTETLEKFKAGEVKFLIASDVAARGIDIESLPWVINFDVPFNAEDYVHRIGRTGRAGRSGSAFTLATPDDARNLADIVKLTGKEIPTITIEGVETPAPLTEEEQHGRRRGGRGGRAGSARSSSGRERGGRSGASSGGRREPRARHPAPVETAPEAPAVAVAVAVAAESTAEPKPRTEAAPRADHPRGERNRRRGGGRSEHGERGGERSPPPDRAPSQAPHRGGEPVVPTARPTTQREGTGVPAFSGSPVPAFLLRNPPKR